MSLTRILGDSLILKVVWNCEKSGGGAFQNYVP